MLSPVELARNDDGAGDPRHASDHISMILRRLQVALLSTQCGRAFNIDSLTVGRTEKPEVSRMTIVVDADHDQALRVEANLYKLVNVLFVENITGKPAISRDLAMIKVTATHGSRSHVLELVNVFRKDAAALAPFPV